MKIKYIFNFLCLSLPCFIKSMEHIAEKSVSSDMVLNRDEADFIWTASKNNLNTVEKLAKTVNIDVKNKKGSTALHFSAYYGNTEIVKFLLSKGARIDIRDKQRKTPLQWAAGNGKTDIVEILLQNNADPDIADLNGDTPLHWTIFNHHEDCARKLLNAQAYVNTQNNLGITPLQTALSVGDTEITKLLLAHNALFTQDKKKKNVLHYAILGKNNNCFNVIIESKQYKELSQKEKDALIHGIDIEGSTPLHYTASLANTYIAQHLIRLGADTNMRDNYKLRTPLHVIIRHHKNNPAKGNTVAELMHKKEYCLYNTNTVIDYITALKEDKNLDISLIDDRGFTALERLDSLLLPPEERALLTSLFDN